MKSRKIAFAAVLFAVIIVAATMCFTVERTERSESLAYLQADFRRSFCALQSGTATSASDILDTLDGRVVSHTKPVLQDGTYSFDVTVTNTGSFVWSNANGVKLAALIYGEDTGYRAEISSDATIQKGESYVFAIREFELPKNSGGSVEFVLVREGVAFFGNVLCVCFPIPYYFWIIAALVALLLLLAVITILLYRKRRIQRQAYAEVAEEAALHEAHAEAQHRESTQQDGQTAETNTDREFAEQPFLQANDLPSEESEGQ